MAELTRGEKAKQTRIARIGLEAYKAEQASKGKKGGTNSVGQFKANPNIAKKAGERSRRLPKSTLTTDNGLEYQDLPDMKISPKTEVTDAKLAELDANISNVNRTKK